MQTPLCSKLDYGPPASSLSATMESRALVVLCEGGCDVGSPGVSFILYYLSNAQNGAGGKYSAMGCCVPHHSYHHHNHCHLHHHHPLLLNLLC